MKNGFEWTEELNAVTGLYDNSTGTRLAFVYDAVHLKPTTGSKMEVAHANAPEWTGHGNVV